MQAIMNQETRVDKVDGKIEGAFAATIVDVTMLRRGPRLSSMDRELMLRLCWLSLKLAAIIMSMIMQTILIQ